MTELEFNFSARYRESVRKVSGQNTQRRELGVGCLFGIEIFLWHTTIFSTFPIREAVVSGFVSD